MAKVIVERPRIGGKYNRKGRNPKSFDDQPKRESMKKMHKDRKSLNENLKPLVRFLESRVGANWDKVYSEICENIKLDSAVQKHVRDHVFDYVFVNVEIKDKKVFSGRRYSGSIRELYNGDLYVDPKTNILKQYKIKNDKRVSYYDETTELKNLLNTSKCIHKVEDGVIYKYFYDKLQDGYFHRHEVTKLQAQTDFDMLRWNHKVENFVTYFHKYKKKLKLDHEYFKTMFVLINNYRAEKEKAPPEKLYYEAGDVIEFSKDSGKTYTEGIVNRVQMGYGPEKKVMSYWITVGDKNVSVNVWNDTFRDHIRLVRKKQK